MNILISRCTATLALMLMLATASPVVLAQDAADTQEQLELFVGDIFEIIPAHDVPNATYTWILTQDRTFIEAGRARTFRKRLITPGRYTLYAEISGGGQNLSRTFVLDYKARTPGQQPLTATGSAGMLVRTSPSTDEQGRVVMPEDSRLLRIDPVNPDLRPIIADLDLRTDSDGDGDPTNDIDTDLTFFQTDATPLYVWIAQPFTSRPMSVTVAQPVGAQQQLLEIYSEAYAAEQGITGTPSSVGIEETGNRMFSFSAGFPANIPPQTPLLYHWEFGDGQESLLANPVHEYAADGTYDVMLRIRDLTNGREVATFTERIAVEGSTVTEPVPGEPVEEVPGGEGEGTGMSIGSILLFAGVFIVSILFGLGLIIFLPKLRGKTGSLSDSIEKMEQSIVKKDDGDAGSPPTITIAPPPSTPPAPPAPTKEPPPEIAEREKEREQTNPALQRAPAVNVQNAPSWLKSGLTGEPAPAVQPPKPQTAAPAPKPQTPHPAQPAPAPKPQTPPPSVPKPQTPPAPSPAPAPQQTAATQTPAPQPPKPQTPPPAPRQPAPAPAPVQSPPATPTAPTSTPAPQPPKPQTPPPAPVQPPAPTPTPAPAPQPPKPQTPPPAPAPQQQQNTPDWLQPPKPQTAAPAPKPQPTATPAPQTPKPQAPPPAPVQQPSAPAPSPQPAKPQTPPSAPAPAAPSTPPVPSPATPNDQPVAFIRADSLDKPMPETPPNPPPEAA